jgi:hypothetical protein
VTGARAQSPAGHQRLREDDDADEHTALDENDDA